MVWGKTQLVQFRALVFPDGGCGKVVILQLILTHMRVLPNGESYLIIKGGVTRSSVHTPGQRNNPYVQIVRRSIYNTR